MGASGDYLDTIELCCETFAQPACQENIRQHSAISYRVTSYLAAAEGWLYQAGQGEEHAQRAAQYLEILAEEGMVNAFGMLAAALGYEFIRKADVLSEDAEAAVIEALAQGALDRTGYSYPEARECGMQAGLGNHTTFAAGGAQEFLQMFPEHPQAGAIQQFVDDIWQAWCERPEDQEIATIYTPYTRTSLMRMAELRDAEEEMYAHPAVREAFERYLHEITPVGAVSKFGDGSVNHSWGFWIACLEKAAHEYQDGRFKWAAQKVHEYSVDYGYRAALAKVPTLLDKELPACQAAFAADCLECYGLVLASLWEATEVEPTTPQSESRVNYIWLADAQFRPQLGEKRQLRLILRGGWAPEAPFMSVGLFHSMGHDHDDATAICTYTAQGAVLLQDSGYFWKSPRFKNVLWARDPDEDFLGMGALDRPGFEAQVTMLRQWDRVSFAQVHSPHHMNLPVQETRTIVFPHDGSVVVIHDHVESTHGTWRVGPVYHGSTIAAQGETYFDLAQQASTDNVEAVHWENPPVNLLVAFGPGGGQVSQDRPEVDMSIWDGYYETAWIPGYMAGRTQHDAIFQHQVLGAGESCDFITVLVPHPSDTLAEQILGDINLTRFQHGTWHVKLGDTDIVINPGMHYVNAGEVITDAHLLYLDRSADELYAAFEGPRYVTVEERAIVKTSGRVNRVSGQLAR